MTETRPTQFRSIHGRVPTRFVLGVVFVLAVSVCIGALLGYYTTGNFTGSITEVFEPPLDGKKVVHVLVLGEDDTGGSKDKLRGLTDTIILFHIDIANKRVSALSIPRDTRVDLDGFGMMGKINAAHVDGGPNLTRHMVSQLTGVTPDYYVKTNVEGFVRSVDILGGVEIDVEKDMHYDDNWGNLHIHLKKGRQLLDGEKAMQYVRFRHDVMGDITRIERQQKFLKALASRALTPANIPRIPKLMEAVLTNVETDMTPRDAVFLARFASKVDLGQVEMATLPGVPENIGGISYWIQDSDQTTEVVRDLFYSGPPLPTVQVLNGSGIAGAAQRIAQVLEEQGYEVTTIGNADSFDYASSQVICHKPDLQYVDRIAGAVGPSTVKEFEDPTAKADVTVIVGRDCILAGAGS